jgi:hypothetical protein
MEPPLTAGVDAPEAARRGRSSSVAKSDGGGSDSPAAACTGDESMSVLARGARAGGAPSGSVALRLSEAPQPHSARPNVL